MLQVEKTQWRKEEFDEEVVQGGRVSKKRMYLIKKFEQISKNQFHKRELYIYSRITSRKEKEKSANRSERMGTLEELLYMGLWDIDAKDVERMKEVKGVKETYERILELE